MITGVVNPQNEAFVRLRVRGPSGTERSVDALLDTGFVSDLTLPAAVIAYLGLSYDSAETMILADGSTCNTAVYTAEVDWDGDWRQIIVYDLGDEILLGMGLLADYEVKIAVKPGGAVEITPLP